MANKVLVKKINDLIPIDEQDLKEKIVDVDKITLMNLRDSLIGLGTILDEDFGANSYVLNVPAGIANMNSAIIAIQLKDNKLYLLGYAKEGLITQNTATKAIEKVIDRISKYLL